MALNTFAAGTVNAEIPASTTSLGERLFQNSTNTLVSIEFKGNLVTSIGEYACYYCRKLERINLEVCTELKTIGLGAFRYCNLTTIKLPTKISDLGYQTFRNNLLVFTLQINSYLTCFDGTTFFGTNISYELTESKYYCLIDGCVYSADKKILIAVATSVKSIEFPSELTRIRGSSFSSSTLTEIKLPDSVTTLDEWAIHWANSVKTLILSCNVRSINKNVIAYNSELERIVIPEGVTELKGTSIISNPKLRIVIFPSTLTSVAVGSVSSCKKILYVSHFHKELISVYHKGGFPLKALLQPLKCTSASKRFNPQFCFISFILS